MIRCKNCGTDNPLSATFCGYCGRTIQQVGSDDPTRQHTPGMVATFEDEHDAPTRISGPHAPVTPPPSPVTPFPIPPSTIHPNTPAPFSSKTPGEEEEEERRRRAALLGIPLIALDNRAPNTPTVQGTPSQPGIPNAPGTPNTPQMFGNMQAGGIAPNAYNAGLVTNPPLVVRPPHGSPPPSGAPGTPPGSSVPTPHPPRSGCLAWVLITLTIIVIIASVSTLGLVLFTPTISLNGASEVQVGNTYQLHGQGFFPSSSVTLTLDGSLPLLIASAPSSSALVSAGRLNANLSFARQQVAQKNTLTTSALGSFDVSLHVDSSWKPGKHTIQAAGSSLQHTASVSVTVTQSGHQLTPTPSPTNTTTPTTTPTATSSPTQEPTQPPTSTTPPTQPPTLTGVTPQSVSLAATAGDNQSTTATVTLTTSGSGLLSWQANAKDSWLRVYPGEGQIQAPGTQSIQVSADASNLKGGTTYNTSVTFYSQSGNSYSTLSVTLTVKQAVVSCINVTPSTLSMQSTNGSGARARVTLTNCGNTTINWSASLDAQWLTLGQYNGSLAAGANITIAVTVPSNSLKDGTYVAHITFSNGTKQAVVTVTLQATTIIG